jgi:hypothetical protein
VHLLDGVIPYASTNQFNLVVVECGSRRLLKGQSAALFRRIPPHGKGVGNMYRDKHPRWWLQSFLAGVATLVLGGRNHTGQLLKVAGGMMWKAGTCMCVDCVSVRMLRNTQPVLLYS